VRRPPDAQRRLDECLQHPKHRNAKLSLRLRKELTNSCSYRAASMGCLFGPTGRQPYVGPTEKQSDQQDIAHKRGEEETQVGELLKRTCWL
jgi:hypothetical protein